MKIRALGCIGGINEGVATTSFLVDDDILEKTLTPDDSIRAVVWGK